MCRLWGSALVSLYEPWRAGGSVVDPRSNGSDGGKGGGVSVPGRSGGAPTSHTVYGGNGHRHFPTLALREGGETGVCGSSTGTD